jgi:HPt (histidine-containing phosphotransfer) domain-containing protein
MRFEDLDPDMQEIIKECQADFIRDSLERFGELDSKFSEWTQSTISATDYVESIQKHVHAMKGVARTIYYEVFHKKSEEIIFHIRQHLDPNWEQAEVEQIVEHLRLLRKELDNCVQFN